MLGEAKSPVFNGLKGRNHYSYCKPDLSIQGAGKKETVMPMQYFGLSTAPEPAGTEKYLSSHQRKVY